MELLLLYVLAMAAFLGGAVAFPRARAIFSALAILFGVVAPIGLFALLWIWLASGDVTLG